uniref:Uncharacterized protein n=1 Tax=Anopheles quadriannulatus TaxID=34691 RepID=A0A182XTD5_ANOQN
MYVLGSLGCSCLLVLFCFLLAVYKLNMLVFVVVYRSLCT